MWPEIAELMDGFPAPMVVLNATGEILAANRFAKEEIGHARSLPGTQNYLTDSPGFRIFRTKEFSPLDTSDFLLIYSASGLRFASGTAITLFPNLHDETREKLAELAVVHPEDQPRFRTWLHGEETARVLPCLIRLRDFSGQWHLYLVRSVRKSSDMSTSWLEAIWGEALPEFEDFKGKSEVSSGAKPPARENPFRETLVRRVESWRDGRSSGLFATAMLELSRLPLLASRLGPSVSEDILQDVRQCLRTVLGKQDAWGQIGNANFGLLLNGLKYSQEAAQRLHELLNLLNRPMRKGGQEFVLMARAGLAFPENFHTTADSLLRNADTALEQARRRKKALFEFAGPRTLDYLQSELIEAELREAIELDSLYFEFQPIYEASTGRIEMLEALSRWHHPRIGAIAPSSFIAAAEDSGLVLQLDVNGLERLASQISDWQLSAGGFPGLLFTLNMSSCHFPVFLHEKRILALIERIRAKGARLAFEVTESAILEADPVSVAHFHRLREAGVEIWLDDFGEGHSSLRYLVDFPVDGIKVSEFFVRRSLDEPKAQALLAHVRMMAESLGLRVVAEGVETKEQWELLRSLGYRLVQGFYYSRALPAEQVTHAWHLAGPKTTEFPAS